MKNFQVVGNTVFTKTSRGHKISVMRDSHGHFVMQDDKLVEGEEAVEILVEILKEIGQKSIDFS